MGVPQLNPLYSLLIPHTSTPIPPTYAVPSLVSTHIYLISLTFSLGPDEAATVWLWQKLVYGFNAIYFVLAVKENY